MNYTYEKINELTKIPIQTLVFWRFKNLIKKPKQMDEFDIEILKKLKKVDNRWDLEVLKKENSVKKLHEYLEKSNPIKDKFNFYEDMANVFGIYHTINNESRDYYEEVLKRLKEMRNE